MASMQAMIDRVRRELGDLGEPFQDVFRGDGAQNFFDLSVMNTGALTVTKMAKPDPANPSLPETLALETDYDMDSRGGWMTLTTPLEYDATLIVQGHHFPMFADADLAEYVHDAITQHTSGRQTVTRYRDEVGRIKYWRTPEELETLPPIEEYLVGLLATIEALWALSTDTATDINISSADGTQVDRGQRYAQILRQIELLTDRYKEHCQQLNVGLFRIEVSQLRRVSHTTGRLVPIYAPREYDEHGVASITRIIPPRDVRHEDESGIPNPIRSGGV